MIERDRFAEYAEFYRVALLQDVVPFWEEHSPDREHGGYYTHLARDGSVVSTDKLILQVAREIRAAGAKCEVYLEPSAKLGKQFSYADAKGIPFVVVVGPDEAAKGVVQLKDLAKREQVEVPRAELAAAVAKMLEGM